jgi:lactate permease
MTHLAWLLALSPILIVLVLMVGFRWGGTRAGPVGWFMALLVALLFFGATPELVAYSQFKAVLLTLYVLYIIWMALLLFNTVNDAGAIEVVGLGIARLTGDRVMQLLFLGWIFNAFLQGVAGFGVPVAVVAPLLVGLGFRPVVAVSVASVGYSWSITFGSIASSFQALMAATGLPGEALAPWSAIFLALACLGCGWCAAHAYDGWRALRHSLLPVLVIGLAMGGTQYFLATRGVWNIAAFMAGLVGLGVGALVARLPAYRGGRPERDQREAATFSPGGVISTMGLPLALSPYLILVAIVVSAEMIPALSAFLGETVLKVDFPVITTLRGWFTPAGTGRTINLFGHAGALLAYTALIAYGLYWATGHYRPGAPRRIASRTVRSAVSSSLGIAAMVGMAVLMSHSGMTHLLAEGLSRSVGRAFPVISPFIGLLGAFMTGSNTNSNVIFAALQQQTADLLGMSALVILGAQTTGGSLGSMLAPAKVIVGCSTAGLSGREGEVMKRTLVYGLVITGAIGSATWLVIHVLGLT